MSRRGNVRRPGAAPAGSAVVECAVCLPVVLLIILASVQACSVIYLNQTLKIAAYEGARSAILPDVDGPTAKLVAESILASRSVTGATVTVAPADLATAQPRDWITISISAPYTDNTVLGAGWFYTGNISVDVSMMAEY